MKQPLAPICLFRRVNGKSQVSNLYKFAKTHSFRELCSRLAKMALTPFFGITSRYIVELNSKNVKLPEQSFAFRELTPVDIVDMLKIMYVSEHDLMRRFERNERCFAVLDGDNIVSYFWAQFGEKDFSELQLKFKLSPNQCWMYNAITSKQYRGRGLYPNLIRHMSETLKKDGIEKSFIDVDPKNMASIRGLQKAGCGQIVKITMKKILPFVSYKIAVFDTLAWQTLSQAIQDFDSIKCEKEKETCLSK